MLVIQMLIGMRFERFNLITQEESDKRVAQSNKEMAKKILNEVKDMFINTNYNIDWIVNKLEEIANREGVEIKE